ncbi:MAG TPA: glutamate mutase L, partial [Thermomicrobiales bacterium]|nr:glutamate mutase L [Thermomicrobiales bacterium]
PQQESGDGVDALLICSTLAEPARVAVPEAGSSPVIGLVLDGLKRAHSRTFHVSAPSGRKDGGWAAVQAEALRAFRPEMVVLVVGSNPADSLTRILQLAKQTAMNGSVARAVVVADGAPQEQGLASFTGKIRFRGVSPVVRAPGDIAAEIERELAEAFRARLSTPDFDEIARAASADVISRAHAVDLVNRFIARAFGRRVATVGIDDGMHVHWAIPETGTLANTPNLDLGASITGLTAREVAEAAIWLPFEANEDELITWVLNRSIRPWTIAEHPRDIAIEQTLARQITRRGLTEIARVQPLALSGVDLVIGGPAFARWNQPGAAALALLDSIDVVPDEGVLDLALDQDGLMAVAGALGSIDPGLAANVFEYDALIHLGSAVIIGGSSHEGDLACRGEIHYENGGMTQFSVGNGNIEVLPLRPGEMATLVLRPEKRYCVGGHSAGKTVTLADERRIVGGLVGVIIDARSRSLANAGNNRPAKVKQWLDALTGAKAPSIRRFN